jgi:DNA-binding transcriptional LysR family regulator/MFS family permease
MRTIQAIYGDAMPGSLRNLDLNLLPTLDALLRERNVTRAAEHLGLSQPAVSAALGRLRRHFGDELLHRSGNHYELTPLAARLRGTTMQALHEVNRVFDAAPEFDPATSEREFTLMISDYATAVLGEHLVQRLAVDAPRVRLRMMHTDPTLVDHPNDILRTVDGLVLPHGFLRDIPVTELYEDSWVCVVSADNDTVGDDLTMADVVRLPWVVMWDLPTAFAPAARQLTLLGVEPRVEVTLDSFLAIPFVVTGTQRLAVLQRRLARKLAPSSAIRILDCPWDVVPSGSGRPCATWGSPCRHQPDRYPHQTSSTSLRAVRRATLRAVTSVTPAAAGPSQIQGVPSMSGHLLSSPSTTARRARVAGRPQGLLLMLTSCLPILGAVLLAPVLPAMQDHFGETGAAKALVPLSLTIPALMIALLAPVAGRIVDRFGRKQLLVAALVVYAVFGTAPLWLTGLPAIVLSRAGVGIAEAAIMTCCTTLIADYFTGAARDRWLGLQTVFASLSATVFIGIGGALGAHSWRTPFWLYASSVVFAVLASVLLWQPRASSRHTSTDDHSLAPIAARRLVAPCAVTLFGGVVFYTPIVQLPYVLDDAGVSAVAAIGAISALASAATAAGAFTFGRVAGRGTARLLPIAFALAGLGLLIVSVAPAVPFIVVGAVVASAGTGLMLPTLLVWALAGLSYEQRGRGTGWWTSAQFMGAAVGGLSGAIAVVAVLSLALALGSRAIIGRASVTA